MENDEEVKKPLIPGMFWICLLILAIIGAFSIHNESTNAKQALFNDKTDPAILQEANAESRNNWAKQCLRLSNNTRTPDECIAAAFKLYPEKDWVGIAKNNEVIYQEYKK